MSPKDEERVREIVAEMLAEHDAPPTITVDVSEVPRTAQDAIVRAMQRTRLLRCF